MGTILRLLLLCFLVGLLLSYLNLSPQGLVADMAGTLRELGALLVGFLRWAGPYVRLGAVVVVPVAVVVVLLRLARR